MLPQNLIVGLLVLGCCFQTCLPASAGEDVGAAIEKAGLIQNAMSTDSSTREAAIAELRQFGRDALPPMLARRDQLKAEIPKLDPVQSQRIIATIQQQLKLLEPAIDEVANQRYACHSGLYWHTDFEQAKQVAARENKPILSLRMLGKLNEDFSCANSRFFRTTLYANEEISQLLREKFVLHWKSIRPVPRVTIDFGDGRKLERTLTGNSIHYVLTSDGQLVDALPGLYGPAAFTSQLQTSLQLLDQIAKLEPVTRAERLVAFHQLQLAGLERNWASDYQKATELLNASNNQPVVSQSTGREAGATALPTATAAAKIAAPKGRVEMTLVRAAIPAEALNPSNITDERLWQIIAELHGEEARLDEASLQLIRGQNPVAAHAARLAISKRRVEDPLVKLVRTLESSIAVDTVRNEYQLHKQIHEWLMADGQANVDAFNERVYAQLFLTPSSDPWLGLAPIDTYTALPNGGVAVENKVD